MPESLGARLRRRREEQHIALSTIAERTKIKASLLEALERGDVSQWPAGIYRRAFIRSYAHAIGLDPDPVVREFLELYPDPEEAVAEPVPPPGGFRGVVGFALGSLARLGGRGPVPETPSPPRTSLGLHDTVPPQKGVEPGAPPVVGPAENAVFEAPSELASDALANDVEEAVVAVAPLAQPAAVDPAPPRFDPDLMEVARICTGFARLESADDLPLLLAGASRIVGALGMIVWVWDPILQGLRPVLAHGYPQKVLAQLPTVSRDEDNATSAAFRSSEPCAIRGSEEANGALVVPLLTPAGASGVLAIELPHGREQEHSVSAVATIFAAMLAPLISATRGSQPEPVEEPVVPPASFRARIARQ